MVTKLHTLNRDFTLNRDSLNREFTVLTLSHEVDEAGDHENRMEVELSLVTSPSEWNPVLALELDDPIEAQRHHAVQEDLGHEDQ